MNARSRVLKIKRRGPSPDRVRRCRELVQKDPNKVGQTEWTFAKEIVLLEELLSRVPVADVEIQAVQVGPAVYFGLPAEMFCQFGLDLKKKSAFPFTFPVTFANGCVGYIPTESAFSEHGGGYETRLTSYSNLEITAGRKMIGTALELAGQMTPGKIPTPPPAPHFRGPWSYGNVPPELD